MMEELARKQSKNLAFETFKMAIFGNKMSYRIENHSQLKQNIYFDQMKCS